MVSTNFKKNRVKRVLRVLLAVTGFFCCLIVIWIFAGYTGSKSGESYLPDIMLNNLGNKSSPENYLMLEGKDYQLYIDFEGNIRINSGSGTTILSNFFYYGLHEGLSEKWGLDSVVVKQLNDSTIHLTGKGASEAVISLSFTVLKKSPKLDISVSTVYSSNSMVDREALVFLFDLPVKEVFTKNRGRDTIDLAPEYWVQQQGVMFGNPETSVLAYNLSGVSSVQVNTEKNALFVNLDFLKDHPHISIPYQEDGGGRWEDQSAAYYIDGSARENHFTIQIGKMPKAVPRIMAVPHGYLAGYIFSEHADGGTLSTHRAVYFGSDSISRIENATGGFVGNKIPVTKSIFYSNPGNETYCSVIDNVDGHQYLDFLDQLYRTGLYELCLHTPEGISSSRERLYEAISFMKNRYGDITWIDHGMESGNSNRECFLADGLNPGSEFYSADFWQEFNILYFWNVAVEKIRESSYVSVKEYIKRLKFLEASVSLWRKYFSPEELKDLNFFSAFRRLVMRLPEKNELNSLVPRKGESYPTPLYWKHPARTGKFYSWVTDFTYDTQPAWTGKAEKWYLKELRQIDNLVNQKGIFINHGYYIRNIKGVDVTYKVGNNIVINPYFEKILEYMAVQRNRGDLYITTIRDLLQYWILCEKITFEYSSDGTVNVINNNDVPVKGLSLIVADHDVVINDTSVHFRKIDNETIVWFDIEAKEEVNINFEPFSQISSDLE